MDFLRSRMFRQTLLCRKNITPSYSLRLEQLAAFHVASPAKAAVPDPDIRSAETVKFQSPDGVTLNTHDPLVKAAMVYLSEVWPGTVPFETLRDMARSRLNSASPEPKVTAEDTENMGKFLLTAYATASTSLVEIHLHPPTFVVEISDKPIASPLARIQAATGNVVTNQRHEPVGLEEFNRHRLHHLDGTRNGAALTEVLSSLVEKGELSVEQDGKLLRDEGKIKQIADKTIEDQLPKLARQALLIG